MWLVAPARWHRARSHPQGVTLGSQRGSEATQISGGSASSRGHGWWWLAGSVLRTRGVFGHQNDFAAPPTPVQPPQDGFRGALPRVTHIPLPFPWISLTGAVLLLSKLSPTPGRPWVPPAHAHPEMLPGIPSLCPRPPQGCSWASPPLCPLRDVPGHSMLLPSPAFGMFLGIPSPCPRPPQR